MDVAPVTRLQDAEWLHRKAPRRVIEALAACGHITRAVGGCVRDAALGRAIGDVDLATDARPEAVQKILRAAGIRVVPTGLAHGTLTAIVAGRPVEVTTLRTDVESFGRHARVAFTDDWRADAMRRDFTLNALYADLDGTVYDPVGGWPDLQAGHIRFIGDPAARIAEDALRILRFFRFYAWFGRTPPDAAALAACEAQRDSLAILSVERISAELLKLLSAPDPMPALQAMAETGITAQLFKRAAQPGALSRVVMVETLLGRVDPMRRLAAWQPGDAAAMADLAQALRLSAKQKTQLLHLAQPHPDLSLDMNDHALRRLLYTLGRPRLLDLLVMAMAQASAGRPDLFARADAMPIPQMPVKGRDVLALDVPPGRRVSSVLKHFKAWWVEEGFPEDETMVEEKLQALVKS